MKEKIFQWCDKNGITVYQLTQYQCRLSIGTHKIASTKIIMDVYWVNRRYHIIRHPDKDMVQKRGEIPYEFDLLLESVFSNTIK